MAGYAVGIASETKAFKQGIQAGVIEPLEDAQDELLALGKSRGPDQLERALGDAEDAASDLAREAKDTGDDFERAMKDAQTATDRLGDETADVARQIEREFRDTYRKVKDDAADAADAGTQGFGKVKDGAGELSSEIGQNLGETVSSFRGDLSDLGSIGQDTLGGLAATVAGTGPAGLLGAFALAAGALGLGAITAGMEEAEQRQQDLKDAADEWADAYVASAGKIVDAASVVAGMNAIATDGEQYATAKENAKNWGVDVSTAMRAMAGDGTALGVVTESLTEKQEAFNKATEGAITQGEGYAASQGQLTEEQRAMRDEVTKGKEALDFQNEAMGLGAEQARNYAKGLYDYTVATGKATDETDDLGNKIYELPDGKQIVVDAKTKTAYEDLDALERKKLSDKNVNVRVNVDDSAWNNWRPTAKTGTVTAVRAGGISRTATWE